MEMQPTRITDIPYELLQSIIILLAKSPEGAEGLARTITVCKHFQKNCEDEVVLRVTNFDNVELSDVGVGLFECSNSLIKRCAQHGNISAQYFLAKVFLSTNLEVSTDTINNYFEATGSGIDEPDLPASCSAYSKEGSSTSSRSSRKLYHQELVRLFMKQCNILDFTSIYHHLVVYIVRFSSEANPVLFFQSMNHMIFILGIFPNAGLPEGRWCYDPETKLLPTDFEMKVIGHIRNQIISRNINMEELQRDCKDMAEISIVLEHGKGNEEGKEGVLELGERFFRHLLSKYFDENVKLLDPDVILSNSSFKLMKKLCVILAEEYEMHRSNALKAFDEAFPS